MNVVYSMYQVVKQTGQMLTYLGKWNRKPKWRICTLCMEIHNLGNTVRVAHKSGILLNCFSVHSTYVIINPVFYWLWLTPLLWSCLLCVNVSTKCLNWSWYKCYCLSHQHIKPQFLLSNLLLANNIIIRSCDQILRKWKLRPSGLVHSEFLSRSFWVHDPGRLSCVWPSS